MWISFEKKSPRRIKQNQWNNNCKQMLVIKSEVISLEKHW